MAADAATGQMAMATPARVSARVVHDWLSRIDKDAKKARDRRIFERWLACWSDDENGGEEGLTSHAAGQIMKESADLQKLVKSDRARAEHTVDFDPPLYNVWKQQEKTGGSVHFGPPSNAAFTTSCATTAAGPRRTSAVTSSSCNGSVNAHPLPGGLLARRDMDLHRH